MNGLFIIHPSSFRLLMSSPPRTLGLAVGLNAMMVLAAADALFVFVLARSPVNLLTPLWIILLAFSLPVLAFVAYRTVALLNAQYLFTQNALVIVWGPVREIIPMADITGLVMGGDLPADLAPRGLWWPGCLVGRGHTKAVGDLTYYATASQQGQIIVATTQGGYVISPLDIDGFVRAFEEEGRKGITEPIAHEMHRPQAYDWLVWRDRWAQGLVMGGLALPFLLLVAIAFRYPGLPATVPLHFDTAGNADRMGSPGGLFILPIIGGLVWLVNSLAGGLLHVRSGQRPAAYLLWAGSALVQLFLWVAAVGLLA
ncbi:MAG: DUF1648 domain-containing protein [Chloroflexi bacterium]|nr:DUF1648 domain-containing protein [Chloroflexota bacterium]